MDLINFSTIIFWTHRGNWGTEVNTHVLACENRYVGLKIWYNHAISIYTCHTTSCGGIHTCDRRHLNDSYTARAKCICVEPSCRELDFLRQVKALHILSLLQTIKLNALQLITYIFMYGVRLNRNIQTEKGVAKRYIQLLLPFLACIVPAVNL